MDEQKRLLLALALMAIVVVVMTSFWPTPSTDGGSQDLPDAATASSGSADAAAESEESEEPAPAEPEPAPEAEASEPSVRELRPEKRVSIESPEVVIELSTHGGGLTEAKLLDEQFRDGRGEKAHQIDLVSVNLVEHPELTPLAFTLVQKQLSTPAATRTAEGTGVLRLVNDGSVEARHLETVAEIGAKLASKVVSARPYATLEDLEKSIGGSESQQDRVVGKLLAAAWRTGYVRLDFEVLSDEDDRVVLRGRTDNKIVVTRTVTLASDYEVRISDQLRNEGSERLNLRERLSVTGLEKQGGSSGWFQRPVGQLAGLCAYGEELVRSNRGGLAGESSGCSMGCGGPAGAQSRSGQIRFVAVDRHFFMTALSPSQSWGASTCDLRALSSGELVAAVEPLMFTELGPDAATSYVSTTFLGPKRYTLLRELSPGRQLWEAIDYGWFAALSHLLLKLLRVFYGWMGNWGLAIILLTFLIKLILLPITHKSLKSMRQMQAEMAVLKPQMDEINERYKDKADVKQQKLMELYQQNGINPLKQMSGCLPMFLQMPIWIALYRMISESVELYRAPFYLWLNDLSAQDPYYILPALLGASMFLQQLVTPQPGVDNAQAKMMRWMMPAMFLVIMINMPAGLVLYIFANTLLTIVQQQVINRMIPAGPTPAGKGKDQPGSDKGEGSSSDASAPSRKGKSKRRKRK